MSRAPVSRPRILVATKTTAVGGAERQLMNALPHLDQARFDYRFVACDDDGPLGDAIRAHGFALERLPDRGVLHLRNAVALRRMLRRDDIALVHAHLPLVGALVRVAATGTRARIVYTEHNVPSGYHPATRFLNRATVPFQDRLVAVSREVQRAGGHSRRVGAERSVVIPNGIDARSLVAQAGRLEDPVAAVPPGALILLVPATLARRKGQDVLLDALRKLPPRFMTWLAGTGPTRAAITARVGELGLSDRVSILGRRDDVPALMARADIVVLPSRAEGHPLALLEALALARPVVATTVGGVPEIVRSGETGLLVPPGDSDALARALLQLADDPALRTRLGARAAHDVRGRFDIRRSVTALESIFAACLAEDTGRPKRRQTTSEASTKARIASRDAGSVRQKTRPVSGSS